MIQARFNWIEIVEVLRSKSLPPCSRCFKGTIVLRISLIPRSGRHASLGDLASPDFIRLILSYISSCKEAIGPMLSSPPFVIGYPNEHVQSAYYPGEEKVTKDGISFVSNVLDDHEIELENTRLQKVTATRKASSTTRGPSAMQCYRVAKVSLSF